MADQLPYELVSPEKLLASQEASMVVVPGSDGLFGVLPGHAPLIATCSPGVIDVYDGDSVSEQTFIAGGVAEVDQDGKLVVLAEEAVPVPELDKQSVEHELSNRRDDLADAKDADERARIEARIAIVKAKLQAVTGELVV